MHFDFHAMPCEVVPSVWCPESYTRMLDECKPDFMQCDTKGHAGLSSYPTNAGTRAILHEGLDILKFMREETAKRGIALYGHHSGLYEQNAVKLHPDWAVVDENGKRSTDYISVFSPYVEELLLPQLRELAGTYHLDGAWVDGDCWASYADYSHWAQEAWCAAGHTLPLPKPGEDGYEGFRDFVRVGFERYVARYVDALHAEFPRFQITSNWIYSARMPEKTTVGVDFLSGDYDCANSLESARFQGRALEARGMPWDLISWGQNARPLSWATHDRNLKGTVQLCQEAAVVIAMGGCFQFFNIHYGHGGILQPWGLPSWKEVAAFCRARRFCFGAHILPELGILLPFDRSLSGSLYPDDTPGLLVFRRWIQLAQDSQFSTKTILPHQLQEDGLQRFQAIIVPSSSRLAPESVTALLQYVKQGGRVLVDGGSATAFATGLGFTVTQPKERLVFVQGGQRLAAGETPCNEISSAIGIPFGHIHEDNFLESPSAPAGYLLPHGLGGVAVLNFSLGDFYETNRTPTTRDFLREILDTLGYIPSVTVTGSHFTDLTVCQKDGRLLVNLINFAGEHNVPNVRSFDEIPAIGLLTIRFVPAIPVNKVTLLPENRNLPIQRNPDGSSTVTLERLEIHAALEVQ
ncbi:MAG: hypothetical protein IJJ26_08065 [Victivallales bacterium]|nr:hypothetical protein [Victivallales bacterium]